MKPHVATIGLLLFLLLISSGTSAQTPSDNIEKGVSEKLALHRQSVLSQVRYTLFFDIPVFMEEAVKASANISFYLKKDGRPLQLDFKANDDQLHSVSVNGKNIPPLFTKEHIIISQQYLQAGFNNIELKFTAGNLSLNRNKEFLYTLLVPDRARTVFPCFDQPGIKAQYQLSLALPRDWIAVGNAPLNDSSINGERKLYRYKASDVFSSYLFSFVAGKFEKRSKDIEGRLFNFYYRETDSAKIRLSMDTILGAHVASIRYLEEYTGIPFPFQKLDFIAIPDFQYGGMEHVGAIDYKASSLFLDSGATKDQENTRENLIAHETAHMWFGNLVTMTWFNDVWMKEVFANFMADKMTQQKGNSNNYELKFLISHLPDAYGVDRTAGANPIRQPLTNLQEAGSLYGAIIYHKAPVMMRQLERLMGKENFREGLREYLKKYSLTNADWPALISILKKHTTADLEVWNKVWVNTPGRPQLNYSLQQKNGLITSFNITQKGERANEFLLPQLFDLALIYEERIEEITVNMNAQMVSVNQAKGKKMPLHILFNSSGQGYGLFPIDKGLSKSLMSQSVIRLEDPVMRASAYINWYENMLSGNDWKPSELLNTIMNWLSKEKEELNVNLLAGQFTDIFWRLIPSLQRASMASTVEPLLWNLVQRDMPTNNKKILFKTFQSIAFSKAGLDSLFVVWKNQQPPVGVTLTEEDYTSMALNLAVKDYPDSTILHEQWKRISNLDRKQRLIFLMPALSPNVKIRDAFFASLGDKKLRKKESWVIAALGYLHHPLRAKTSGKYLPQTLKMLQDVQITGDIFFPGAWLSASFGSYQTSEAADVVRSFLQSHPGFNRNLKAKILQAADPLFRAEKLLRK